VVAHLSHTPLAGQAHTLAAAVSNGSVLQAIATVPPHLRGIAAGAARAGFVDGLNAVILIGAVIALVAAVLTFVLIRQRDFVGPAGEGAGAPPSPDAEAQQPRASVAAG
jgi:hypothetical protein